MALKIVVRATALLLGMLPCVGWAEMIWGANGHPFTAYSGLSYAEQIEQLHELGGTSYRVDVTSLDQRDKLRFLLETARERRIDILPILIPPVRLKSSTAEQLRTQSAAFAEAFARAFPDVEIWELGNELENYAIIQPCEMRDDGTQYPCEWGPAAGVGPGEYFTPRYLKVAAVLRGLSEGIAAANPKARRAIGTAGWGHLGFFERLAKDHIAWEITVWHMYEYKDDTPFRTLARYGKPIWVTEFNHSQGSHKDGKEGQAAGLSAMMRRLVELNKAYDVEATFIYELFDEPYWAPSFEASMGVVSMVKGSGGQWTVGPQKPAFAAAQEVIRQTRPSGR
ncbi:hypothetical protein [Consotaella salsifontis]|uniref:Glycosyl hydrolase catalytic core n=1 Tax=Consotaella salsifontis TaxID=1365950 RepID=A0A1T4SXH7_9HYPH|nr:hypothetical protein [Consotaella salsifontis]SKA32954.1 hypothetical protein SAMN05428963_11581 [Consotaella salsifontis]